MTQRMQSGMGEPTFAEVQQSCMGAMAASAPGPGETVTDHVVSAPVGVVYSTVKMMLSMALRRFAVTIHGVTVDVGTGGVCAALPEQPTSKSKEPSRVYLIAAEYSG